ncbi:hypothetical protein VTN00DRAFT_9027 [Thermoascus crustaceus]|uniref:uncharacterized protein n=1 Tax=Thermoascus crustaceus TaxID=5088 RepID=UPI003744AD72
MSSKSLKIVTATKLFVVRYNPHQVPSPVAVMYMNSPSNPIAPKIRHMYANRDRNTLWWKATVNQLNYKKVVRSWCRRRVRAAFQQALRERGFDEEGRKIAQEADGTPKVEPGLKGTAEIIVLEPTIKAENADLQKEMNLVVDLLLKRMRDPSWLKKMFGPKGQGDQDRQHKPSKKSPNNRNTSQP